MTSTDKHYSLDSEDDFRSGCRNVSHQQQFFSEISTPRRSHSTNYFYYYSHFKSANGTYSVIQVSTAAPVAVPRQRDTRFIARQTVSLESQDNQPQIVMSPNSREMDDPPPPYESVALGNQTVQFDLSRSYTSVAIPAGNGIVEFRTVTPGAHEEQTQIVQPPDSSSAVEDPPPPYEAVALGYQTVQFDLPPPFASVPIQAVDDNVEFQTVSSGAQGDQPQIVQPPGSLATENTPPYEDIASDHQAFTVDTLPPYDEAVNGNLTFNAQLC